MTLRIQTPLLRPADPGEGEPWTFLILPLDASAALPSRGMIAVEGSLNGQPFHAMLEPDGRKSHWLKVTRSLSDSASVKAGDQVTLEISPAAEEPEPDVPADFQEALDAATSDARALWSRITPAARRHWIQWIVSPKKPGLGGVRQP